MCGRRNGQITLGKGRVAIEGGHRGACPDEGNASAGSEYFYQSFRSELQLDMQSILTFDLQIVTGVHLIERQVVR